MKKLLIRILGFAYYQLTGIRVHNLYCKHKDMGGSLNALSKLAHTYGNLLPKTNWEDEFPTEDTDAKDLSEYFKQYGSDKSTRHNYYLIYADILKGQRNDSFNLLEIGLGTPSASVSEYCASSKAFRDWAPNAQIYGADIRKDILFQEERIHTYYADQTDLESLKSFTDQLSCKFDLIIDDGLHTPWANFNTITATLPLLKDDGVLVVEDILNRYVHFWPVLMAIITPSYVCKFVKMKYQTVCIIQKNNNQ